VKIKHNKKAEVERHNREYERKQQYKLAYEIMAIKRLETRDYLQRDKRSRAKAMQLMILTSALSHTG